MIRHEIEDVTFDGSNQDELFDEWGELRIDTPLLRRSIFMEETGFQPQISQTDDNQEKAKEIWAAYQSGVTTFIKQLGKENKRAVSLSKDIRDKLLSILEGSILAYAFADKGRHNTKKKQITKIKSWLDKGLDIAFISPRINRVIRGIRELFVDILYWGCFLRAEGAKDIKLTNSDLHNRGLGVAFVTYVIRKGALFRAEQTVKKVIKPEDKSLEKALLGTNGSLAQELNRKLIGVGGRRLNGNITALDIRTSRAHGSMVEFFEGEQIDDLEKKGIGEEDTESDSKTLTQIFSALTGMDDLHTENLTYKALPGTISYPILAMIDADNALSKRIFGNLASARKKNSGFGDRELEIQNVTGIDEEFIMTRVKPRFAGKRGRTVPVRTGDLAALKENFWRYQSLEFIKGETWDIYINFFIDGIKEDDRIREKSNEALNNSFEASIIIHFLRLLESGIPGDGMSAPGLRGVVGPADGTMTKEQKKIAVKNALMDFQSGQIPFYEYDYSSGFVLSHGMEIWQGPNLDEIFSREAVRQMLENLANPNRE